MQAPTPPSPAATPWRPWIAVLAAGAVCLAGLLMVVALFNDRGGDMPPALAFSAAGVIVAAISIPAIVVAARL